MLVNDLIFPLNWSLFPQSIKKNLSLHPLPPNKKSKVTLKEKKLKQNGILRRGAWTSLGETKRIRRGIKDDIGYKWMFSGFYNTFFFFGFIIFWQEGSFFSSELGKHLTPLESRTPSWEWQWKEKNEFSFKLERQAME